MILQKTKKERRLNSSIGEKLKKIKRLSQLYLPRPFTTETQIIYFHPAPKHSDFEMIWIQTGELYDDHEESVAGFNCYVRLNDLPLNRAPILLKKMSFQDIFSVSYLLPQVHGTQLG